MFAFDEHFLIARSSVKVENGIVRRTNNGLLSYSLLRRELHEQLQRHPHLTLQLTWKNIGRPTRTATLTAVPANSTNSGDSDWTWCCARSMWRKRSSSSITPAATIPIHDPQGGPERQASIFVAVLGASNYTYAEATGEPRARELDRLRHPNLRIMVVFRSW